MWRSRLIASARFRSIKPSFPVGESRKTLKTSSQGLRCVFFPDQDDERASIIELDHPSTHQRRHLSIGRRHGWKGPNEDDKHQKKNFAKEYLEPAARGELKEKHSSGIPKLAARKSKGHNVRGDGDTDRPDDLDELDGELTESDLEDGAYIDADSDADEGNLVATMSRDISRARKESRNRQPSGGGGGFNGSQGGTVALAADTKAKEVISVGFDKRRDPEYWKEEDYDDYLVTEEDKAFAREILGFDGSSEADDPDDMGLLGYEDFDMDFNLDDLDEEEHDVGAGNDGSDVDGDEDKQTNLAGETEVSDEDGVLGDPDRDGSNKRGGRKGRNARGANGGGDDDGDIPKKLMDVISPLKDDDDGDFWKALKYHPTQYAEVRYYSVHPESKREPRPYYPKDRTNPPAAILDFFMRWLYITGLPPALPQEGMKYGTEGSLSTLQQQEIQKTVTRLLGVSFNQVFPANATSAFVGFESPEGREFVLQNGPKESVLSRAITTSPYTPSEEEKKGKFFMDSPPGSTVLLENIPPVQLFRDTLLRDLFPEGSELGAAYPASSYKVTFPSPTTALVQFDSDERAKSAASSEKVAARLQELGQYPVRLFRARRNLVHQRMDRSLEDREIRKPGERLIVDGDMPSKFFFLSHAGTIMLRNLDRSSVTKESITELFQPFAPTLRDEQGSVEFVECHSGLPTDRAYVGFDRLGEAEAVMKAFGGYARIGDTRVTMKLVKDRGIPGLPKRVARPERTEEELLKSLNDWEQYVDPEDIKYLEKHGVAKVFIDEALRGMRFQNRSFGALDWAMRDEKLEPEKKSGDDYKELVQMYISTLKECIATPEDPGDMYVGLHFPGEPIDLSIFDMEKKRQRELLKKRGL